MSSGLSAKILSMPVRKTKDFLLRGISKEVVDKLKVAASLHGVSMREYIETVLKNNIKDIEKKGIKLSLPKKEGKISSWK